MPVACSPKIKVIGCLSYWNCILGHEQSNMFKLDRFKFHRLTHYERFNQPTDEDLKAPLVLIVVSDHKDDGYLDLL